MSLSAMLLESPSTIVVQLACMCRLLKDGRVKPPNACKTVDAVVLVQRPHLTQAADDGQTQNAHRTTRSEISTKASAKRVRKHYRIL